MILLIALMLIYQFGLPWWMYPIAVVVWIVEVAILYLLGNEAFQELKRPHG